VTLQQPTLKTFSVNDCKQVEMPQVRDPRGNLTFIEEFRQVPFEIKRVYYLYEIHAGSSRAGHAHRNLHQLLIPLSGSFDCHLDDGREKRLIHMNLPHRGLLVTPMIWRVLDNFSSGAVCLVLASELYDESDYFRDYDDFLKACGAVE
jgi:hypothetical protein